MSKLSKIVVVLMAIAFISVGSAAVVSYLSNMGEADVNVASPMTVELRTIGGDFSSEPLVLANRTGGETSTVFIRYTNHANQDILCQVETLITCDATAFNMGNQIDHADFEDDNRYMNNYQSAVAYGITAVSVKENGNEIYSDVPLNFEDTTHDRGTTLAVAGGLSGFWPEEFPANTKFVIEMELHHAPNAVGSYTVTTEIQDDKTDWV